MLVSCTNSVLGLSSVNQGGYKQGGGRFDLMEVGGGKLENQGV